MKFTGDENNPLVLIQTLKTTVCKLENHAASVAIYFTWYNFTWYNFGRVHQTLKTTLAIKAGVANHVDC